MGKVIVQESTTMLPLTLMGIEAGVCWGADTTDIEKNKKRGMDCLKSGHGRVAEFPQIYLVLEGYSARLIREFYTHIAGGPTRLQESTRYINCKNFDYVIPPSIDKNDQALYEYVHIMKSITDSYQALEKLNIPKEDIANILPLGMTSKIVVRTNLRNLIDMSHQRMCSRAYWEFRNLMKDITVALSKYSSEWETIVKEYFKPKCEVCGFCTETKSCGRKPAQNNNIQHNNINLCDDGK